MKKFGLVAVVVVLALSALACSISSLIPTKTGTTQEPPVVVQNNNVLFSDDFSSSGTGWEVGNYDMGTAGYGSGYYYVSAVQSGINMYGMAYKNFSDLVLSVQATQYSAPSNNNDGYGVICRLQSDDGGYYFRISGDGFYSVALGSGGNFTSLLSGDDWQTSSAINQGNATNQIEVTCNGSQLKFVVNGTTLFTGSDSTFSSGDIALLAITYEDGSSAEFHYDNLVVSNP